VNRNTLRDIIDGWPDDYMVRVPKVGDNIQWWVHEAGLLIEVREWFSEDRYIFHVISLDETKAIKHIKTKSYLTARMRKFEWGRP